MTRPLRHFILRTAAFAAVFMALMAAFYIAADPLKTLRWYPSYNADREQINAGVVTLANFDHYNPVRRYDSFIIGNSLSQYCYVADWQDVVGHDTRPYHLSSSSQSVYTTLRFLRHAAASADTVRHVLIALDVYALSDTTSSLADYYDTDPPALFPAAMRVPAHIFHATHALSREVLFGWAARCLTGRFPEQPCGYPRWRQRVEYNPEINEIYWPETEAWLDTAAIDEVGRADGRAERIASRRYHVEADMLGPGKDDVVDQLRQIRALLDASGADWRFVILPASTGAVMSAHDDSTMYEIFGDRYLDMSTAATPDRLNPRAYLDPGHPRPAVFREILRQVYR